jgi:hypothetical protein
MTMTSAPIGRRSRPRAVVAVCAVLGFLGISGVGGGIALSLGGVGAPPREWLADVPIVDDWLVPGLVLGLGFGLGSLIALYGVWRRPSWAWLTFVERATGHHWSYGATILIGLGQVTWIGLEVIYLPELSALQIIYGGVGAALIALPALPSVRSYLRVQKGVEHDHA